MTGAERAKAGPVTGVGIRSIDLIVFLFIGERVPCFDVIVAFRADDGVIAKRPKSVSLVSLLEEDMLASEAPSLFIFGVAAIFYES